MAGTYVRWPVLSGGGGGSGTVTLVSVVTANGLAGTVANASTTPAITLRTTVTGILQGNGTAISAATIGNLTDVGTDGITVTGGTNAVLGSGTSIAQHVADSTHNGYLSSTDWSTFNGKQAAGNYITALTGDGTASGPGSVALTLATVNSNVGSFGSASSVGGFTVNGKGLITAASSTSIQIAESQVTNLVSDLAAKQSTTLTSAHLLVGNVSNVATDVAMSGDISLTNAGATAIVATTNSTLTTLSGLTTASSLSTVGTVTSGTWNATTIAINHGGTGQTSANPAFNALSPLTTKGDILGFSTVNARLPVGTDGFGLIADSAQTLGIKWAAVLTNPMTTGGDMIYGGASGTPTRLANGSANQYLVSAGGTSAPVWTTKVAARTVGCTATITSSFSNLTLATVQTDTGSGFSGSSNVTTYTTPSAGLYSFCLQVAVSAGSITAGQTYNLQIFDNTNSVSLAETFWRSEGTNASAVPVILATGALNIASGVALLFRVSSTATSPVISASTVLNYLSIVKE